MGWGWRAGGGFHVAVLDYCGPGLVPHLLVGLCILFWRQGGGAGEEGPAPDPHGPQWEVDVWILVWLLPPFPVAMECPFLAWLMPTFATTFRGQKENNEGNERPSAAHPVLDQCLVLLCCSFAFLSPPGLVRNYFSAGIDSEHLHYHLVVNGSKKHVLAEATPLTPLKSSSGTHVCMGCEHLARGLVKSCPQGCLHGLPYSEYWGFLPQVLVLQRCNLLFLCCLTVTAEVQLGTRCLWLDGFQGTEVPGWGTLLLSWTCPWLGSSTACVLWPWVL